MPGVEEIFLESAEHCVRVMEVASKSRVVANQKMVRELSTEYPNPLMLLFISLLTANLTAERKLRRLRGCRLQHRQNSPRISCCYCPFGFRFNGDFW